LINSDEKEILEAAPQPQNYEQELYMELLKKYPKNIIVIDATKSIDDVCKQCINAIEKIL